MFRGNAPASVDGKGRLKIPRVFLSILEPKYGREHCTADAPHGVPPVQSKYAVEAERLAAASLTPYFTRSRLIETGENWPDTQNQP